MEAKTVQVLSDIRARLSSLGGMASVYSAPMEVYDGLCEEAFYPERVYACVFNSHGQELDLEGSGLEDLGEALHTTFPKPLGEDGDRILTLVLPAATLRLLDTCDGYTLMDILQDTGGDDFSWLGVPPRVRLWLGAYLKHHQAPRVDLFPDPYSWSNASLHERLAHERFLSEMPVEVLRYFEQEWHGEIFIERRGPFWVLNLYHSYHTVMLGLMRADEEA